MKIRELFILVSAFFFVLTVTGLDFSRAQTAEEAQGESEVQWLWGEVASVDAQRNELVVKYLDYETETEKEIVVKVDDKTTYEGVSALNELKAQDTLSIDYFTTPAGDNIAKNISIEKPEEPGVLNEEATEGAPKDTPPVKQ